ncbi:MAG: PEP-CTERM sorting domain-containing protein [Planctomycetota bacterium]
MAKVSCLRIGVFLSITLIFAQFSIALANENWQLYSTIGYGGGSAYPDTFVTVNPQTGQQTQRGGQGETPYQCAIDMDPISGFLFGVNYSDKPSIVTRIDPITGHWTDVASIQQGASMVFLTSLAFSPNGTLYGMSNFNTLGVINLGTDSFAPIATIDVPSRSYGMDFSPQGILYITDRDGTGETFQQWLRTIDPSTGSITSTLPTGHYNIGDIDFAPDGYIYHTNFSWWLFKLDPSTGEQTDYDNSGGLGPFEGIASDYVPEPTTLLLLGLGWPIVSRFGKNSRLSHIQLNH